MRPRSNVCLVTTTIKGYLRGTIVLIGSFARHHPSVAGDVVVIEHGLR